MLQQALCHRQQRHAVGLRYIQEFLPQQLPIPVQRRRSRSRGAFQRKQHHILFPFPRRPGRQYSGGFRRSRRPRPKPPVREGGGRSSAAGTDGQGPSKPPKAVCPPPAAPQRGSSYGCKAARRSSPVRTMRRASPSSGVKSICRAFSGSASGMRSLHSTARMRLPSR